jgi:GAF domain-containing protein
VPPEVSQAALLALSRFFVGSTTVEETLTEVSILAVDAIPAADFAGISMWEGDRVATRVSTDPEAPEIDDAQYDSDDGPCLDAFRTGRVFRIADMATESRWPRFRAACVAHGVSSTLAVPLAGGEAALGALNFYARTGAAFDDDDVAVAQLFAASAAAVLANAAAYWRTYELNQGLEEAMRSRAVIEQAKGILMAQSQLTADQAFDVLRRVSQRENRKLREVAAELVDRTHGAG